MIFPRRTEPPKEPNTNYFSYRNIYYRDNYGMPNCSCYALGRYHELFSIWLPVRHNAEDWSTDLATKNYRLSKTPLLGSVVIWKVGKIGNGKDGAGHVAIVEAIKANGDIVCSNSGWYRCEAGVLPENDKRYQQMFWYEQTFKASKGYAWTGSKGKKYELIGFVNPGQFMAEPKQTMKFKKTSGIYINAGTNFKDLIKTDLNDTFKYDGLYKIGTDGKKWLHGAVTIPNQQKRIIMGWTAAECL